MPENPIRQPLRYEFEAVKGQANEDALDRISTAAIGQRQHAKQALSEQWASQRQKEEEGELARLAAPAQPPSRLNQTSADNPLPHGAFAAPTGPPPPAARAHAKRTYHPGELPPRQRDQLGPGLVPQAGRGDGGGQGGEGEGEENEGESAQEAVVRRLGEEAALRRQLIAEYPHGVPRLLAAQLAAAGRLPADLPSLAFSAAAQQL